MLESYLHCNYLLMTTSVSKVPVKNVTWIFSCLFAGSWVWFENETKYDGNPVVFIANAVEIP